MIKWIGLILGISFVGCVMDYTVYPVTLRNESKSDLLVTFVSSKQKYDTLKVNNEEGVEPCYFCS